MGAVFYYIGRLIGVQAYGRRPIYRQNLAYYIIKCGCTYGKHLNIKFGILSYVLIMAHYKYIR